MSKFESQDAGCWTAGKPPDNVRLGVHTMITGDDAFKRFHSQKHIGVGMGSHCTMEGVHFAVGAEGHIEVGDYCYFTSTVLLCELEIRIGSYVVIGWNTTIADTDFHPIAPAERIADAIALSPLGKGRPRPAFPRRPVVIENDVYIGPSVTILKGVRIGAGAFIEAGAVVTSDVGPQAHMLGNPARVIGQVAR
jgi:acetyltransferase-like isoleucine patch superfamily enzyme